MAMMISPGPFRVHDPVRAASNVPAPVPAAGAEAGITFDPPNPPPQKGDQYFERLLKLVPAEVLALYVTFKETATEWLGIWAFCCLLLVLFIRTIGTRQAGKPIQVVSVVVASVSFVLWIYATGGYFFDFRLEKEGVISVAVGVWTFLIPYVYKGD